MNRINGGLSLNQIAVHLSNNENEFFLYLRRRDYYEVVNISPVIPSDFENVLYHTYMRDKIVYFNDELYALGTLYDKYLRQGHFFFFEHHLNDYIEKRASI